MGFILVIDIEEDTWRKERPFDVSSFERRKSSNCISTWTAKP